MATFWQRAAHSVNLMFFLLCLFECLVVSHLGFDGGNLVLIAHLLLFCRSGENSGFNGIRKLPLINQRENGMRSIIFDRSFVKPGQLLNIRRDQMSASLDDSLLNYELPFEYRKFLDMLDK